MTLVTGGGDLVVGKFFFFEKETAEFFAFSWKNSADFFLFSRDLSDSFEILANFRLILMVTGRFVVVSSPSNWI